MKNFRDYENLIRETVKKISDRDPNWNFSVKSLSKDRVRIRWTYLDYLEETENCFIMKLKDEDKEFNDIFLSVRTPQDDMITGHIISDSDNKRFWQESYENGIVSAIYEIADYAHSRY